MPAVKQEYLNQAYQALVNYQSHSNAQRRRFQKANYGVNTPIDGKALDDVPSGKIVLTQEVFEQLLKVNDESEKAKAEFAYFLTGTTEGQTVKFDNIVWCRNQGNSVEADYTPLLPNLNAYVRAVRQTGEKQAIVCSGHTHPKALSRYAEDFSLYDMAGYMQMKEDNAVFKSGTIDFCGGVMSDLSFNFCFYDDKMKNFYKFNDVVLELESGQQVPLSCYDRKISRTEIADKIMNNRSYQSNSFRDSLRQGAPTLSEQAQFSRQAQRRLALQRELGNNQNSNNERY